MTDAVELCFLWRLVALAALTYAGIKLTQASIKCGRNAKREPRTSGLNRASRFQCMVTGCCQPANRWNDAEHAYMCDDCATELAAHRKRYPGSRDSL